MRSLAWPTFKIGCSLLLILSMILFALTRNRVLLARFPYGTISTFGIGYGLYVSNMSGPAPFSVATLPRGDGFESGIETMYSDPERFNGPHQMLLGSRVGFFFFRIIGTVFSGHVVVAHWFVILSASIVNILIARQERRKRNLLLNPESTSDQPSAFDSAANQIQDTIEPTSPEK